MKKPAKSPNKPGVPSTSKPSRGIARGAYAEPGEDPKSVTAPKGARKR